MKKIINSKFAINNRKKIIVLSVFLLISFLYFSFPLIIMPDSTEYYHYLKIFYGVDPLSTWNVVRGPSLPIVLFISTLIFGNNMLGLLIGTYLFFIAFNIIFYKIITILIKKFNPQKLNVLIIWILYFIFILFNPILFGYFHSLLTEFVAILLSLISCLLSWKWISTNYSDNRRKYLTYNIIFILLFLFSWFLKQPYFSTVFFPFTIACIISIFKKYDLKNLIQRTVSFIACVAILIIGIVGWTKFLINNGVDYENGRNNEYFLSKAIIVGNGNFRIELDQNIINIDSIMKDKLIDNEDKKTIYKILNDEEKEYTNFKLFNVKTHSGKIIDKMIMFYNGEDYTTKDSLIFWVKSAINHPFIVFDSYYSGYLATINVYVSSREENGEYYPYKMYTGFNHENNTIGLAYLYNDSNFLWLKDYHYDKVKNLYSKNKALDISKNFLNLFSKINFHAFRWFFLILPFLFIYAIFMYIRTLRKKDEMKISLYELMIMLFGFGFFHVLFHVVTGAIIDRYAYVAFPELILGGVLMLVANKSKKKEINLTELKEGNKVLFVIPAYNEELNIGKVINEIKHDVPNADVVVINDCSKDNTAKIVEEKGITCITMPFNVRYAMAVQTGIKYACDNGYDYVIQFDADGQHIAKEAKKLLDKIKETKSDIVIGSRFLVKTDYNHSFFRKIGTKIFSIMISLFCKEKITDPTSGFQCLNRRVIERYSMMGKYPEFPDANLIIEMLMDGYKVCEVPVKMRSRENGESMHGGIIKPIKYMIKMFYTIIIILIRNFPYKRGGNK